LSLSRQQIDDGDIFASRFKKCRMGADLFHASITGVPPKGLQMDGSLDDET
jgi:hypothetical protein